MTTDRLLFICDECGVDMLTPHDTLENVIDRVYVGQLHVNEDGEPRTHALCLSCFNREVHTDRWLPIGCHEFGHPSACLNTIAWAFYDKPWFTCERAGEFSRFCNTAFYRYRARAENDDL